MMFVAGLLLGVVLYLFVFAPRIVKWLENFTPGLRIVVWIDCLQAYLNSKLDDEENVNG